ncbi:hypothetical protein PsSCT_24570 [Pseudomonas sp. SCT]
MRGIGWLKMPGDRASQALQTESYMAVAWARWLQCAPLGLVLRIREVLRFAQTGPQLRACLSKGEVSALVVAWRELVDRGIQPFEARFQLQCEVQRVVP